MTSYLILLYIRITYYSSIISIKIQK
uniref:Uncharacterized protein n=1 Tax=Arundo donax TaxID=35708 RepID=A0A0A8YRN8_ARUDO